MYYCLDDGGKYTMEAKTVSPVYNKDDTLVNRINALIAYMNMPTSFQQDGTFVYGLRSEGAYAAAQECL